jgi:predicted nucleic acid-binding protein
MKDKFPGYYQMPKGDFDRMWKEGIFVFDANFLLDLFRYSDETAKSLLNTLNKIKDRIWIPYQSAHEYHENLYGVIEKAAKSYDDAIGDIISLEKKFETKREHPFLEETFLREVKSFF